MLLEWLKWRVLNKLDELLRNSEEFCSKPMTKLWAHSTQQCEQCWSPIGMCESASLWDKRTNSFSAQCNKSFSSHPNNKQSPGTMHRRNYFMHAVYTNAWYFPDKCFTIIIINHLQKQAKNYFWFTLRKSVGILVCVTVAYLRRKKCTSRLKIGLFFYSLYLRYFRSFCCEL